MRTVFLRLTLMAALARAGCAPSNAGPSSTESVATTSADLVRSTAWLAAHLNDPNLVVIHVDRDRTAYDQGHIPSARFLPVGAVAIEKEVPNELPPLADLEAAFEGIGVSDASRVVLYGGMGGLAPARAFFALDVLGLGQRAVMLDGNESPLVRTTLNSLGRAQFHAGRFERAAATYDALGASLVALLGLAGEASALLAEYKKLMRDGPAHQGF